MRHSQGIIQQIRIPVSSAYHKGLLRANEWPRYSEIADLYAKRLAFIWREGTMTEATRATVQERIGNFAEGDLEYAKDMLSALWEIANEDTSATAPPSPSPGVSLFWLAFFSSPILKYTSSPGQTGFESCSLGRRQISAYQVHPQRHLL